MRDKAKGDGTVKPKVYIAEPVPTFVENYLSEHCDYDKWEQNEKVPRDVLLEKIQNKDGLLNFGSAINEELLEAAPNLKVVSNISVGYDNFDLQAMAKHNVIGTNTPYVLDDTVADLVFALMLSAGRRVCELDSYVKNGEWNAEIGKEHFGLDVHHSTIGIIGMGRIGEAVAKRAKFGFDMDVLYYNRRRKEEAEQKFDATYCDLQTLLKQSDFIVLLTPLTDETYHLIGEKEFSFMKETAIFINASRGKTVDEEALIHALTEKKIFAAGIDTFTQEPIQKDNPLLSLQNVVTLPHIGSATLKTRQQMAMTAAENLVAALQGKTPPNIVRG
ncbi:D-glycerate dehydrogenase [Bacillus cereus]|uniref:Glyoxylate/hydroxypyruvate reductase B n=1 Tax=Bacillus cereus (strain 03BB102) TaxID=572264 RepID=A0A158RKQ1_BACC3|nr:D-glycerate dehydrogenase [Bacillus cereus]ACO27650.1 D-isomer specific 2-hydroxyacid dehydrogenase family protein [Bacillus cereus 03BB102]AJG52961.1 D-isomer specific 2-hydroxyacid dehydrogenase, NAD binding domain protein [Bacillus cereus 03BB102]MDA1521365.1 D-glycerate dehydrogenase [Bacillus cereus]PYD98735.1 D-glycerate dehydrogenase [Bacillus cereus]QPR85850.1 D-glycerate dehydrogenase [Bacillus cereus]